MSEARTDTYQWDIENPQGYANAMGRYKTKRELAFLLAHVIGERQRILDVGGGSGRFAMPLAERGHDVTVVDISEDALRLLERRNHSRISTRCADFLAHTFDSQFDVVVSIEAIPSFTSIRLADLFAKIRSVLRPGGRFVFTELNSHSWRHALHTLRGSTLHALRGSKSTQYNVAGPNDYLAALWKAGFELVSIEGFVWMPFTVACNSRLVPLFESLERALHLNRWIGQSPWLLIAAQRAEGAR
jgi:2-polyprenyl-3-methyl-5-hydroxy-6-metoxy-1,4-benzoquinol methylase